MTRLYRLVPLSLVPLYKWAGWTVSGQDERYPGHCWMERPE
jgi:hypothetical protein